MPLYYASKIVLLRRHMLDTPIRIIPIVLCSKLNRHKSPTDTKIVWAPCAPSGHLLGHPHYNCLKFEKIPFLTSHAINL